MVSDIVSKGNEIEAEASRVLWAANSGDVGVDGLKDVEGAVNAGALFALEPAASPEQVNEWWNGLGTDQQNWIATHRPDWVRNRDGIPTDVRNETNRTFLDTERTRLQDQLTREQQSHPNPNQPPYGVPAQLLQRQIAVLDKLDKTLEQKDTYLIGLDTTGESLKTIVSVGNPDEADNVAVTIPGMGSQIDAGGTIEGMVREGSLMQSEVMTQLDAAGRGHETVATVAWLGYDTPRAWLRPDLTPAPSERHPHSRNTWDPSMPPAAARQTPTSHWWDTPTARSPLDWHCRTARARLLTTTSPTGHPAFTPWMKPILACSRGTSTSCRHPMTPSESSPRHLGTAEILQTDRSRNCPPHPVRHRTVSTAKDPAATPSTHDRSQSTTRNGCACPAITLPL